MTLNRLCLAIAFSALMIGALWTTSPDQTLRASNVTAHHVDTKPRSTTPVVVESPVPEPAASVTTTTTTVPPSPPTMSSTTTTAPAAPQPVVPATTAPAPTTPAESGSGGWSFAAASVVAACEEGGWGRNGFNTSYIGDLGISRAAWFEHCQANCSDLSPSNQIAVASRIQPYPPDTNGCTSW